MIKKYISFIKTLGLIYFFKLFYIYFIAPIFAIISSIVAKFYRRFWVFWYHFNIKSEFERLRQKKDNLINNQKDESLVNVKELGLNADGLKKIKKDIDSGKEICIGDVDQDGLIISYYGSIKDIPTVSRDNSLKKTRFSMRVILFDGFVAIKKEYIGDRTSFLNELIGLHKASQAGCNAPKILDIDFDKLIITFSFITGKNLREMIALAGGIIRDHDIQKNHTLMSLSLKNRWNNYLEEGRKYITEVIDSKQIDEIFIELKKLHSVYLELYDIKYGNVIIERITKTPYLIDFDSSIKYNSTLGLFRSMMDRDIEKFNKFFIQDKLTYKRLKERIRTRDIPYYNKLYAPVYLGHGLRIGNIWDINVGHGRWNFILKKSLPKLSGKRILSLGANNGYNEMQMIRHGASEVIGIERDVEYIDQGNFLKEAFEWADNKFHNFKYINIDMQNIPTKKLGSFDLVTAFCSLYYLDDNTIRNLVSYVNTITDVLILQCNVRRNIGRDDLNQYKRASLEYNINVAKENGFPEIEVIAPYGYSRPLIIARKHKNNH
jgi:hypothetical protein